MNTVNAFSLRRFWVIPAVIFAYLITQTITTYAYVFNGLNGIKSIGSSTISFTTIGFADNQALIIDFAQPPLVDTSQYIGWDVFTAAAPTLIIIALIACIVFYLIKTRGEESREMFALGIAVIFIMLGLALLIGGPLLVQAFDTMRHSTVIAR